MYQKIIWLILQTPPGPSKVSPALRGRVRGPHRAPGGRRKGQEMAMKIAENL